MGCGPSSEGGVVDGDRPNGHIGGGIDQQETRRGLGNPRDSDVTIRVSPASSAVDNDGVGRPAKVDIVEVCEERPRTKEEGAYELPYGDFTGGMLGVADDDSVNEVLATLRRGELFCDPDFSADNNAVFFRPREEECGIVFLRPKDLVKKPQFFVDGVSRTDVVQGSLGDCWFLSSCAAIAKRSDLLERVAPPNQPLCGDNYHGLVYFHFWRFGQWVTVIVDDLLPTKDGELIFAHCSDPNEFWVALLEKAYAKLHGSYEALEGGQSMEALVDLTGGLTERYDLDEEVQSTLYKRLLKASGAGAFITCSRKGDWTVAHQADSTGLVQGHAYTVTGVARVKHLANVTIPLIRVRNPWGNSAEWTGEWSDGDKQWEFVNEKTKEKLNLADNDDGEFWMSFNDFCKEFEEVSIATLGADMDSDGVVDEMGQVKAIHGRWEAGITAGGSRNNFISFASNPQYLLSFTEADDSDEDEDTQENSNSTNVLIALMQEYRRSDRHLGVRMHQIGFVLYETDDPDNRLPLEYFLYNYGIGTSGTYINYREVLKRFELEPGHYIIVPATFKPECESDFMIRVFAGKQFNLKLLN